MNEQEMYQMRMMNQIVGLNPTGQVLFKNGKFQTQGNPAMIMNTQTLQSQRLDQSSQNDVWNTNQKVVVQEGFINLLEQKGDQHYFQQESMKRASIFLWILILGILFLMNIKKI